jgi:predicted glycoside hydrolase/deacetylase ChbG (UPF0249 family)
LKRLVVTADDVGLHPGMTRGARRAHDAGIVTAVSLCAVSRDLEDAAAALRARPRLDVGIHLVLVGERPLSPAARVPTLVGRDARLLPGFRAFTWRYARRAIAPRDLETELRAQIEAVLGHRLQPVHLNSHQHLHVLPGVLEVVLRLAVEYGIPWVRVPADRRLPVLGRRGAELRVLDRLGRRARLVLAGRRDLRAANHTAGLFDAGHLDAERLLAILGRLEDSTELVCHPGIDDHALGSAYDWGYGWEEETAALCDPRMVAALAATGATLAGFRDL